ncbi:hypothetical protein HBI56_149240 [Parastagonospora nodorum]|uniref:Uncharacterized protein n=2 Tax=Phaeosphaeria nodorum (strain SN15 / ATCC MYA-4574 / FGSC 10173) TaxID=321614 RepID=Q0U659_PHANO|nr:hypothetical protein SNOG_12755 [Parastagonospora nodorum SN15]KAH3915517.1 hypothetical protein HBH56_075620 [Parastagonospora nodorum]EAT80053.1 hypothetical protein SNOG_12755 [Parastagonospora nodorum SN15]KAH3927472.1 hypothetical protein HBH54_155860 [Parastagonospora nodorum]KAH3952282.1 hypothetical protein HBH53_052540 [Parastagonospora nodorum]KAH3981910.1 hypothetical protein HBH51_042570 [Parastagonospora nodorum]
MSSSADQPNQPKPKNESQQNPSNTSQEQTRPLPLPSPSDESDTTRLDMSGGSSTVKLDHMGPLVVNKDGTLSRISNWGEMSEIERQNTLRVLGKRNMLRREALEKEGREEKQGE